MGLEAKKEGNYLSIISGSIRKQVSKGTDGAVIRKYETSDGKTGEKYELIYSAITGKINDISFHDSEFGKQMSIQIVDGGDVYNLQMSLNQAYAEDLMRKLPNVDLTKEVKLSPYDFLDDNSGKNRKGITVYQGDNKIENYFWDNEKREPKNGLPQPEGDKDTYDKDDWKMYYIKVRKFLEKYIQENVIPKLPNQLESVTDDNYPKEDINPDDIPF